MRHSRSRHNRPGLAAVLAGALLAALLLAACAKEESPPNNPPNSTTMATDSAIDSLGTELDSALSAALGAPAAPFGIAGGGQPMSDRLMTFAQSRSGSSGGSLPMAAGSHIFDGTAGTQSVHTCWGGGSITIVGTVNYNDSVVGGVGTFSMDTGASGLTLTLANCNTGFDTLDGNVTISFADSISLADDGTYSTFSASVNESVGGDMTVTPAAGSPIPISFASSTAGTMTIVTLTAGGALQSLTYSFNISLSVNGQTCSGSFTESGGTYGCS